MNKSYIGEILDQDNHLLATVEVDLEADRQKGIFALRSVSQGHLDTLHIDATYLDSAENGRILLKELEPCSMHPGEYRFSFDRLS